MKLLFSLYRRINDIHLVFEIQNSRRSSNNSRVIVIIWQLFESYEKLLFLIFNREWIKYREYIGL